MKNKTCPSIYSQQKYNLGDKGRKTHVGCLLIQAKPWGCVRYDCVFENFLGNGNCCRSTRHIAVPRATRTETRHAQRAARTRSWSSGCPPRPRRRSNTSGSSRGSRPSCLDLARGAEELLLFCGDLKWFQWICFVGLGFMKWLQCRLRPNEKGTRMRSGRAFWGDVQPRE